MQGKSAPRGEFDEATISNQHIMRSPPKRDTSHHPSKHRRSLEGRKGLSNTASWKADEWYIQKHADLVHCLIRIQPKSEDGGSCRLDVGCSFKAKDPKGAGRRLSGK